MRLDQYLVENKYFESRNKAKAEIEAGNIIVNDKKILKASFDVSDKDNIKISDNIMPYVSRGGLKLLGAINEFRLDFKDKIVLDIGASTGGFTDCSLKHGASHVYAIDVGSNQLHESLKNDSRVTSYENTNIKDIDNKFNADIVLMDVSFVSIEYLLPHLNKFITDNNLFICLIKPQFEVGNINIKGGIVKDRAQYLKILNNINNEFEKYDLGITKLMLSPILGGSGNKEFIAQIERGKKTKINFLAFLGGVACD